MPRPLRVAAAQVGRIDRGSSRPATLARLLSLIESAAAQGVRLVVFPETTFTTFFPRYLIHDSDELALYFERELLHKEGIVGSANVKPLFDRARELGVDIVVGYAELTPEETPYNTCVYVSAATGTVVAKYRKVHLPGSAEPFSKDPGSTNQLEKRYFKPGNLGFKAFRAPSLRTTLLEGSSSPIVGMLICNDRRWAEAWRAYGLQGTEIMCCGYNTSAFAPELWGSDQNITREQGREDALFHHKLFCIAAGRCGWDDGKFELIAGSIIVDPQGKIIAESTTDGDELVVADIDLDACRQGKSRTFCFAKHRMPEHYGLLTQQVGVVEPPDVV